MFAHLAPTTVLRATLLVWVKSKEHALKLIRVHFFFAFFSLECKEE